ncbi:MAG TPA: COX15/CtaA family protein, partial [Candidatus Binatia bacterium]
MSVATGPVQSRGDASVWPHRLAVVLACATFPLLFIGGLVTSKGAGLAVPDWPTTFGYNMFLYPWSKMVGNIFYEHSHRLVASGVGLLTIALTLAFWLQERRRWLRRLGVAALLLVILQGVIGGLRVVLLENTLAIVHAAFAQAFFALTVSLAIFTSPDWNSEPSDKPITDGGRLSRLCAVITGLIYLQAIFGAVLRHTGERVDAHLFFALLVTLHVIFVLVRVV